MEVYGAVPNRAKAKRCKGVRPGGKPARGGEARYPSACVRIGDGVGTKFHALTWGGLSASVKVTVDIEVTRW